MPPCTTKTAASCLGLAFLVNCTSASPSEAAAVGRFVGGDVDPTVGAHGVVAFDFKNAVGERGSLCKLALDPAGRSVVACHAKGMPTLARLTAEGAVDRSFGTNGYTQLGGFIVDLRVDGHRRPRALLNEHAGAMSVRLVPSLVGQTSNGALDATFGDGKRAVPTCRLASSDRAAGGHCGGGLS
ncbi:MAG: hypothetical protein KF764_13925 [Labilithrix sp.]|nr:hypothetical protein [Labilithrix sp.]